MNVSLSSRHASERLRSVISKPRPTRKTFWPITSRCPVKKCAMRSPLFVSRAFSIAEVPRSNTSCIRVAQSSRSSTTSSAVIWSSSSSVYPVSLAQLSFRCTNFLEFSSKMTVNRYTHRLKCAKPRLGMPTHRSPSDRSPYMRLVTRQASSLSERSGCLCRSVNRTASKAS